MQDKSRGKYLHSAFLLLSDILPKVPIGQTSWRQRAEQLLMQSPEQAGEEPERTSGHLTAAPISPASIPLPAPKEPRMSLDLVALDYETDFVHLSAFGWSWLPAVMC